MEIFSSRWGFDPRGMDVEAAVQALTCFRTDIPDETFAELLTAGGWSVLPIGRSSEASIYGLRLLPGRPLAESPVVHLTENRMATVASAPRFLVPVLYTS